MTLLFMSYLLTNVPEKCRLIIWNVDNPVGFPVLNDAVHIVMKLRQTKGVEMHNNYSSNFLICHGGQNDVMTC